MTAVEWLLSVSAERNPKYALGDIGLSRLFHDLYREKLIFVINEKTWHTYNGKFWQKDVSGLHTMEFCKEFVETLNAYAEILGNENYKKAVKGLCSRKKRESILNDAKSISPKNISDLDRNKLLFNCENGTFNLATGLLQPHNSVDLITKISAVHYNDATVCLRWEQFVNEIMCGDIYTAEFLQKAFGYCLSGETLYECFFILFGATTRNGKSTACETIANLLGDYASTAQPESIAKRTRHDGSSATPDMTRLKGARFVSISEPERGLELNVALIKQLTGGDTFTGRMLRENPIEFTPEFKMFLNTNYLPRVNDDTIFSSGRVKLIPFRRHFSLNEQDKDLKRIFRQQESISGIFNWLVQGYNLLKHKGLNISESMKADISDYEFEADIFGGFLAETIEPVGGFRIRTSDLYRVYSNWTKENGYKAMNNKNFISELRRRYEIRRDGTRGNEIIDVNFVK